MHTGTQKINLSKLANNFNHRQCFSVFFHLTSSIFSSVLLVTKIKYNKTNNSIKQTFLPIKQSRGRNEASIRQTKHHTRKLANKKHELKKHHADDTSNKTQS